MIIHWEKPEGVGGLVKRQVRFGITLQKEYLEKCQVAECWFYEENGDWFVEYSMD